MAAPFPRWSTHVLRGVLLAVLLIALGVPCLAMALVRSPYTTEVHVAREQPVAFDHRHHVLDDGIDCRYCHGAAEHSAYAGVPSTAVCMGCHAQVWPDSPALAPLRESWRTQTPIAWVRVTRLPDFVYFNHQVHVRRGVGCSDCHGEVEHMARVEKASSMTMGWCLDCHRHPQEHVRPLEHITDIQWHPSAAEQAQSGPQLVRQWHLAPPTTCSACHR